MHFSLSFPVAAGSMINITFTPDTILMICTDSDDKIRLPGHVPSVPSPFVVSVVCMCVSWFQLWFGGWGWGWQPELCVGMWLRWREDFRSLWAGVQRTGGTGRRKWLSGFGGILGCVETSTFWKVGYSFSKCKNTSVSSWWELQPRVWRPLKRRLSAC